jgi:alpha(1,3/1,4) fucosyltransferase
LEKRDNGEVFVMKKPLVLGFTDTHEQIINVFSSLMSRRFDVQIDNENPKYLIFGDNNFGNNNQKFDPNKVVKIFYTGENQRPWDYTCHYAISFDHIENDRMYRLPLYSVYDYDNQMNGIPCCINHLRKEEDVAKKTGFCSFVVRNPNCEKRNIFFHKLSQYKKIDAGGPLFNNIGYVLPYGKDAMRTKLEWLPNFKFNMCFENSSYPGYTTEKIYEAFIGNTVPIYWGSTTVETDFNTKAFLNYHDYDNDEDFIRAIIELDINDDKYMEMYMQPMFSKGTNRFMDLNRFLNWFETNVYKG